MDYEKAYKEALERAREELGSGCFDRGTVEYIFPELKESEDERIRKEIIKLVNFFYGSSLALKHTVSKDEMVAWLEKQGEPKEKPTKKQVWDYCNKISHEWWQITMDKWNTLTNEDKNKYNQFIGFNDFSDVLMNITAGALFQLIDTGKLEYEEGSLLTEKPDDTSKPLEVIDVINEKQGEQKSQSEPIKDYQGDFGCWNNTHDFRPKHLQRCLCYDKYMGGIYCYVYDDISKYWCTQTTEEHDPDGDNHISDYSDYRVTVWMPLQDTSFYPSKSIIEKQGEQKPADKVEPKFKVGDWIIRSAEGFKHNTYLVTEVKDYYVCEEPKGGRVTFTFNDVHKNFKLWDISDAKNGDVLVGNYDNCKKPWIGIFKNISESRPATQFDSYCFINSSHHEFITPESMGFYNPCKGHTIRYTSPATKKQRDILFQKMKEAGYEWDAENKELKKIEKKLAWSEEDEVGLGDAVWAIEQARSIAKDENDMGNLWYAERWLKSIKDRMKGE